MGWIKLPCQISAPLVVQKGCFETILWDERTTGRVMIKLSKSSLAGTWLSLAITPTILYFSPKILPLVIYVTMEHTELSWLTYLSMAGIIIILFSTTDYVVLCPLFTILSVCPSKYYLKKHFRIYLKIYK